MTLNDRWSKKERQRNSSCIRLTQITSYRQKCKESRRGEDQQQEEEDEENRNLKNFNSDFSRPFSSSSHGDSIVGTIQECSQSKSRTYYSKSVCRQKCSSTFLLIFVVATFMTGVSGQSKSIVWNPVDESSVTPTKTPTELGRQLSSSSSIPTVPAQTPLQPAVTTLQAMASHPKTQRRKPPASDNDDVLPRLTFIDSNNVAGPPQVTHIESNNKNIIPTHVTFVDASKNNESEVSANKDEILVENKEEKAESRPEDEKEIIIYDDIYPRRVKLSQYRQASQRHRQTTAEAAWRQQQQQRRRHESERRRRYYGAPPWRQHGPPPTGPARPPYAPPSTSGSTRYFLPPIHQPPSPHLRPPYPHGDEEASDNSVRTVVLPNHKKPHPPPPPRHSSYQQLVPVEQDLLDDDEYDDYSDDYVTEDEPANRRHDYNWWLGPQPTRRNQERGRSHSANPASGGSNSLFRSIMGVSPFCLHDDIQFNCVLTPVCWMAGGETLSGCESMLYSCCVEPSIARKDVVATGRGVQKRVRSDLVLRNEPECGITKHRQFSKRIIGGEKAQFAELPWQVHIRISSYQCGGVLLNHWYVATAAHCVHQAKLDQITVHLGEFDTKNSEAKKEPLDSESFEVESITLHPDFRYMLTQPDRFDIALLKLDHPVFYKDNIIPICLPTQDYPLTGKEGTVAGWGKTDNSFGKTGTNVLNKVQVPIIDNRKCKRWHKDKAIAVQLHDEMFCAGYKQGQQDACLGDSGGPLVINFEGRWTLIGITSAGFGCAVEKQPGIYHKVSKTAQWISRQISTP